MKIFSLKMFVSITYYLSAVWLWNVTPANGAGMETRILPVPLDSNPCDLAAPGNFHITDMGTNFISTAWEPVQGAQAYYLKVVNSDTWAPITDTTVTTTSVTMQVPAGGPYHLILAAVSEGCLPSRNTAIIPDVFTLIVDLIVTGRTMPQSTFILPEETCYAVEAPDGTFWFRINYGNNVLGNFEIKLNPSQAEGSSCLINLPVSFGKDPRSLLESLQAYIHENNDDIPPCAKGRVVRIKNLSPELHDLFDLDFDGSSTNTLKLCVTPLSNTNYTYSLWMELHEDPIEDSDTAQGDGSDERNNVSHKQEKTMTLSIRNPFTENLEIQMPEPAPGSVRFQLFNLNGIPVLDQQFPAVQQYNLPTAGLPPGFYLLRTDAAGVSRTYKVVKAR